MQSKLTSIKNLKWANAEHTAIDCIITTSQFGDEQLPFTANMYDVEAHGRQIFEDITTKYASHIAEYVAPAALPDLSVAAPNV